MYIKNIGTGETRAIPQPEGFTNKNVQWEIPSAGWFPDSTRFLANAHPPTQDPGLWSSTDASIWIVSILGSPPRKLRDKAVAFSVSPDGSLVSFGTNKGKMGEREIWLMGPSGEQAKKMYDAPEDNSIFSLFWTPDGRRVLYAKVDESGLSLLSRELNGGPVIMLLPPSETKKIVDFSAWLPDGRLLYSERQPGNVNFSATCNYWTMRLDGRTGQLIEKPRQLTKWTGYCMSNASVTADGKELVFLRWVPHMTSYMAELKPRGMHIVNLRHFPLTESSEGVAGWTADSKEVILVSNRSGHFGIYKQSLDEDTAEPLVTDGYCRESELSPDGKSIFYLGIGENESCWPARAPEPVMRVPITGGPSQLLFMARPPSQIVCARFPSNLCAIAEPSVDHKQLIVTAFDTLKGRGLELTRFVIDPTDDTWWLDLSSDGTRIAATRSASNPIDIVSVRGEPIRQINVKGWSNLLNFTWAADSKGLYVVVGTRSKHVLLYVDLQGNAHVLWENARASGDTEAYSSPDGRHLAISSLTTNSNMWMLENF